MFYLAVLSGGQIVEHPLGAEAQTVGREPGCDLVLDEPTLSRRHFSVQVRSPSAAIRDLGSRHGLYLDGERVQAAVVSPGEWFFAGSVQMSVRECVTEH